MTSPLMRPDITAPWSVDDLFRLPEDGQRYEIFDGSLLVTPPPPLPHTNTTYRIRRLLERHAPSNFVVIDSGVGIYPNETNYFIPDILVFREELLGGDARGIDPHDALLAVEVVSPSNSSNDYGIKRHAYAKAGIPQYWIADKHAQKLLVLGPGAGGAYEDRAVVRPGEQWRSDEPFPLAIDPAEVF